MKGKLIAATLSALLTAMPLTAIGEFYTGPKSNPGDPLKLNGNPIICRGGSAGPHLYKCSLEPSDTFREYIWRGSCKRQGNRVRCTRPNRPGGATQELIISAADYDNYINQQNEARSNNAGIGAIAGLAGIVGLILVNQNPAQFSLSPRGDDDGYAGYTLNWNPKSERHTFRFSGEQNNGENRAGLSYEWKF